jgi:hypothetical protein
MKVVSVGLGCASLQVPFLGSCVHSLSVPNQKPPVREGYGDGGTKGLAAGFVTGHPAGTPLPSWLPHCSQTRLIIQGFDGIRTISTEHPA